MLKDMSSLTFFGWLANKLNGVAITNSADLNELRTAIAHPPIMPRLAEETKLRLVRKLIAIGVPLV